MTKWFKKAWNILNGSDKNWDGNVDIHDKMMHRCGVFAYMSFFRIRCDTIVVVLRGAQPSI